MFVRMNRAPYWAGLMLCGLVVVLIAGCPAATPPAGGNNGSANDNENGSGSDGDGGLVDGNTNSNTGDSGGGTKDDGTCTADGTCNVTCFMDTALPADPDCTNADICDMTGGLDQNGFCCTPDLNCDTDCPEADPECSQVGIMDGQLCADFCNTAMDGVCNDGGSDSADSTCDFGGDCTDCGQRPMDEASENDLECFVSAFCCSGDLLCDENCAEPDPDCGL